MGFYKPPFRSRGVGKLGPQRPGYSRGPGHYWRQKSNTALGKSSRRSWALRAWSLLHPTGPSLPAVTLASCLWPPHTIWTTLSPPRGLKRPFCLLSPQGQVVVCAHFRWMVYFQGPGSFSTPNQANDLVEGYIWINSELASKAVHCFHFFSRDSTAVRVETKSSCSEVQGP